MKLFPDFQVTKNIKAYTAICLLFCTISYTFSILNTNKQASIRVVTTSNQEQSIEDPNESIYDKLHRISINSKSSADTLNISQASFLNGKVIDVPYFNQCLETDKKTFFPNTPGYNNLDSCRYMCSAAVMVMIGGYFNRLNYDKNNPQSLKKYMYSNEGQGVLDTCGNYQGGAFGMIAKETDKQTQGNAIKTDCNAGSVLGMRKYANHLGLYSNNIDVNFNSIKNAIDRGNPVILGTEPHITVVIGYTEDKKLVVNDPYRNTDIDNSDYSYDGNRAVYDLPDTYYKHNIYKFIYALEISQAPIVTNFLFKKGSRVRVSGVSKNLAINIRRQPCNSDEYPDSIKFGVSGVVIDEPIVLEFCSLENKSKNWYKVEWQGGEVGWVSETFLSK